MPEYSIGARIDDEITPDETFKKQDPFSKKWEDIKSFQGLEKNFKRRSERMVKAYETAVPKDVDTMSTAYLANASARSAGVDGSGTKQINPGTVYNNGYGLFDVITPPWNLYELANYYDTSFANHAAIDAKVENIVGLG